MLFVVLDYLCSWPELEFWMKAGMEEPDVEAWGFYFFVAVVDTRSSAFCVELTCFLALL